VAKGSGLAGEWKGGDAVIPPARVLARVLTACAVSVGLVFMHGLGAAIGTGCAGGTPAEATSVRLHAMVGGHDTAMAEATMYVPGDALANAARAGHSSVCDSTPPRGRLSGQLARVAIELVGPGSLGRPAPGVQRAGGAMPRAGPALLVSLGVSRT
jgi:hypothetical protein